MARSHPPTLLTLAERTLREECALPRPSRILVAVSGGGDSQALLHVLSRLSARLGLELDAHGVDHGLRPEAAEELELARALAERSGVPFSISRLRVTPGGNLMARARAARHAALERAAASVGAELIATAHHADDRAETVLERLLRGAGPRGLAVLPPRAGTLIRPLLRARRTDVQAHLERHRIPHASDPTNFDRRFMRARLRFEVLPMLESLSPKIVEHLAALADQLAAPPPPELEDRQGRPLRLGRAQVRELRRLLEKRDYGASVALGQNLQIRLDPATGQPEVLDTAGSRGAVKAKKSD